MLQMKIKAGRRSVMPGDLPSILGAQRAYREIGDMVEALLTQMDMLAGDATWRTATATAAERLTIVAATRTMCS